MRDAHEALALGSLSSDDGLGGTLLKLYALFWPGIARPGDFSRLADRAGASCSSEAAEG